MTKTELIAQVALDAGLSKVDAQNAVNSLIANVVMAIKKDGRLPLYGLGVFEVVKKPKRHGRNPRTGEPLIVKAHKAVKFKPARRLKDSLNGK